MLQEWGFMAVEILMELPGGEMHADRSGTICCRTFMVRGMGAKGRPPYLFLLFCEVKTQFRKWMETAHLGAPFRCFILDFQDWAMWDLQKELALEFKDVTHVCYIQLLAQSRSFDCQK